MITDAQKTALSFLNDLLEKGGRDNTEVITDDRVSELIEYVSENDGIIFIKEEKGDRSLMLFFNGTNVSASLVKTVSFNESDVPIDKAKCFELFKWLNGMSCDISFVGNENL
jgi:hypothetical protein